MPNKSLLLAMGLLMRANGPVLAGITLMHTVAASSLAALAYDKDKGKDKDDEHKDEHKDKDDDEHEDKGKHKGWYKDKGGDFDKEAEDAGEPGLLAMWSNAVSHAQSLNQVDWSRYDQISVEEKIDWEPTNEAFYEGGPTDYFAVRLSGRIEIPESGVWYFFLSSDAGARLFIDGALLINDDANHSYRTRWGMVSLTEGFHDVEVRYLERNYSQGLRLQWQGPSMDHAEDISGGYYSHVPGEAPVDEPGTGLRAYWTLNASHAEKLGQIAWTAYSTTTLERNISWEITNGAFYTDGPTDYFAVRLLATIEIPETGAWYFELGSDAGARMYIDDELVVGDEANHSFRFSSNTVWLEEGEHKFEVQYLERNYSQGLVATWKGPSDAFGEVIPPGAFTPRDADDPVEVGGLNAYWTDSASHASTLGQVDWDVYDTPTSVARAYWPITNSAFYTNGPTDYFALRLLGTLDVPEAGNWTFNLGSDAGAQLLIDGQVIVNDDANHSFRFKSGSVSLAGGLHEIDIRYLERNYSQGLVATWKGPGDGFEEVIPTSALQPRTLSPNGELAGTAGLRAYWTDGASHATRLGEVDWAKYDTSTVESRIYWPISNSAFREDGPTDYFAVRLVGKIDIPASGDWTFRIGSDAGARLYIDNAMVVNDDANHSFRFSAATVTLPAGKHDFDVRYLERNYSQGLVATWTGPSVPYEEVIPEDAFTLSDSEPVVDPGGGLLRAYWTAGASHATRLGEVDWSNFTDMTTESNVSWRITNSAFYPDGATDYFALRLVGKIDIPTPGAWIFKLGSDAGARLYIDNEPVINDDANHGFRFATGSTTLTAGEHDFDVRYLERHYSQGLVATWQGPGDAHESVIPSSVFSLSDSEPVIDEGGGGLRAYWTSGASHATTLGEVDWADYTNTTIEEKIAWEITNSAFYTNGPTDYFAVRLVGTIAIPESGEWTFKIGSDAGARLLIDGEAVASDDANHGFRFSSGSVLLGQGDHTIEVQHLERNYSQGLVATWQGPSDNFEEVIPSSVLTPAELESPGGPLVESGRLTAEWYRSEYATSLAMVDWSEPDDTTSVDNVSWRITNSALYAGGPTDYFALRLTGELEVPEAGTWTFKLGSDAGAELYVNGELVVGDDANHSFRFTQGSTYLEAGRVSFEVRYLERNYSQGLFVTWQGPQDEYESVIPATAFVEQNHAPRRVARWRETNQRATIVAALRAEIRKRGLSSELAALRELGLDDEIPQLLGLLGSPSVRAALGDEAAVLTDLSRDPLRP